MYINIHGTTAPALSAVVQCTNCTIHSYLCGALHQLPSPLFFGYFLAGKNKCVYLYFIFEKNFIPIYRAILLFPQICICDS